MTAPHPHTSELAGYNLLTIGDYQFAVWYTLTGELRIGRIQRGVHRWGVNHLEYEFAGAPRTALALPVSADEHNYPTLAVDNRGFLHVWANMHDDPMQAVKSTTAHTTGDWLATAGWASATGDFPGILAQSTYPIPVHFDDGGLLFLIRDVPALGGSGSSDTHFYRRSTDGTAWEGRTKLFQGVSVPGAGPGATTGSDHTVDDVTNWSAYPTVPVVEPAGRPHPGRLHMSWVWRVWQTGTQGTKNWAASYGYSDDRGTTWKAIDGSALTLPITPLNSIAARMPGSAHVQSLTRSSNIVVATVDMTAVQHGLINGDTITVDVSDTGYNGTFTVGAVDPAGPRTLAWFQSAADDPDGGVGTLSKRLFTNWGALAIDDAGFPHILASTVPSWYIRRNTANTGWLIDEIANPFNGETWQVRPQAAWLRGDLWMMRTCGTTALRRWAPKLLQFTGGTAKLIVGGDVDSFGDWEPAYDPEAYRRYGTIEVLTPDGNTPRVVTFGRGPRVVAHVA